MVQGHKDKSQNIRNIITKRLLLRAVEESDVSVLMRLWMDEKGRKHLGGVIGLDKAVKQVRDYVGKKGFFCVTDRESGNIIGLCSLDKYRTGEIEASYQFFPEFWGKGFATEAIKGLIEWGFENMNIEHVIAVTQKANVRSRRLLEKLGMICVDEFIEHNEPQVMYSISKETE